MTINLLKFCFSVLLSAAASAGIVSAQTVATTSKPATETKIPIFKNGSRTSHPLANFWMRFDYKAKSTATLSIGERNVELPAGSHILDLKYEQLPETAGILSASLGGSELINESLPSPRETASGDQFVSTDKALHFGDDFTIYVRFRAEKDANGTLVSKCLPDGAKWVPDAKALFIRKGRLVYDIGWLGALSGGPRIDDGRLHEVAVIVTDGHARMLLDGKEVAQRKDFTAADKLGFVFQIGKAAPNFAGDLEKGKIENVRYWKRSLDGAERKALTSGKRDEINTPDLNWTPRGKPAKGQPTLDPVESFSGSGQIGIPIVLTLKADADFYIKDAWVQPLDIAGHADLIRGWNEDTFAEGKRIYQTLCVTCHGTPEKEGSIPTAMKFHEGEFKNGSDPYRIYQTLTKGYGLMIPQPQYNAEQKYALIHYLREEFLEASNSGQLFEITDDYLASLPQPLETWIEKAPLKSPVDEKPYEKMDFGPAMMWTFQVNERGGEPQDWNIAQKGINLRLDQGPGGVSQGKAWMVYETDTMRVAAAYAGNFSDWRGIAFDGSHGTHTRIAGEPLFITADAPGWQNPESGNWEDQRIVGRDGRRFGPLPSEWIRYEGIHYQGEEIPVIQYRVGKASLLEQPGWIDYGAQSVFTRTLNIQESAHDLVARLAPDTENLNVALKAPDGIELSRADGWIQLTVPSAATPANLKIGFFEGDPETVQGLLGEARDLAPLLEGGPSRFEGEPIEVAGVLGDDSEAFAVDTIPTPNLRQNPWHSWMRIGGFDFFPENPDRAAVCTWLGDVWLVDGISGDLEKVTWKRICSGLFQPLGLKVVDGTIYVTCRDQIARLHDRNGDEEIDFVECFNNDAQVTEHFHEFAMGLQTDDDGNFYYAKSARHALKAVVPHHGTLLRVSPDGSRTDIIASGFRAANGVCVNPDGTWIVTDQEGHWNPKNRINYVREGGFYGNMFGYHDVTDSSNEAMEHPLCWITNAFDRSPAELVWVPENGSWGSLNGALLNLSYGYGQVYTVPHEILENGQAQGGMCALPIEKFPTGLHRGRFHPENRQLYAVGMFAWAGSQKEDGGFFRIRATGKPAYLPIQIEAKPNQLQVTFSDELPTGGKFAVRTWDLKRTAGYGSKHYNEKELDVSQFAIQGNKLILTIPDLKPTWGMEVRCELGNGVERVIHNTIHQIPAP